MRPTIDETTSQRIARETAEWIAEGNTVTVLQVGVTGSATREAVEAAYRERARIQSQRGHRARYGVKS